MNEWMNEWMNERMLSAQVNKQVTNKLWWKAAVVANGFIQPWSPTNTWAHTSQPQTESRSVQPFLQGSAHVLNRQTDRQTVVRVTSVKIGHNYAMRPLTWCCAKSAVALSWHNQNFLQQSVINECKTVPQLQEMLALVQLYLTILL